MFETGEFERPKFDCIMNQCFIDLELDIISSFRLISFSFFSRRKFTLIGHRAEISSAQFNWDCSLIATGSMDKTCKIWETRDGMCTALHYTIWASPCADPKGGGGTGGPDPPGKLQKYRVS